MAVFFLTSALMIMAVLAIRFFFKNKLSFLILYPLWGLVLLRLLLPVNIIESPISIINLTDTLKSFNNKEILTFDAEQKDISGTIFLNTNNQNTKNNQNTNNQNTKNNQEKNTNINKTTQNNKTTVLEENKEPYKEDTKKPKTKYENHIIVWISGSTIFFIFVIISNVIFYKKLKTSRKHVHTNNKGIPVYISDIVNTPCLTGVLHPAVYLPSYINNINLSSDNMQDMYLKQILSHEYTHIKHKDHIWALMRMICLGVYWFNPFVWIAAFYSKQDAELACDEAVLKNCTDDEKYNYGKMLLVISQKNSHNKLYIATSLGSSKSNLKERITMITKKRKLKKRHIALITSLSIILAGCGMTSGTTTYNNDNISNTIAAKPANTANSETPKPPKDDKRIKAFEKFMQGDILSRPEWRGFSSSTWHEFNGGVKDLYFSIQYTKENIPCLFVTNHTSKVSDNTLASSYAMVYCYDQDSKRVEFLTYMACSSSGESVSIKDGVFITDTHHSYSAYNFTLKDNKNTVVLKIIEGYYMAEGYDNNYTYTKYQWTVPVDKSKIKSNIYETPLKKYADVTQKKHYDIAKAIKFEEKCTNRTPIAYYKNTQKKWEKFYKDGHIKDSYLYPAWSDNINKKIIKSLEEIKKEDFAKAVDKSYILIGKNKTRMSYCGKLSDDMLVYYLNTADYASAILIYKGNGHYHAYDTKELKTKNLDLSAVPADFGTKTTTIDSINADVDNDGEDETVFYIYVADKFYVIDYYYDYSYKDYNIVSSHIISIGTFEKDYSGID